MPAIQTSRDILSHGRNRLPGDNFAPNGGLNGDLEKLLGDHRFWENCIVSQLPSAADLVDLLSFFVHSLPTLTALERCTTTACAVSEVIPFKLGSPHWLGRPRPLC